MVARHFISRGVLPDNIIGIDPSNKQIEQARLATPGATFFQAAADTFELPPGSVDLVTLNTAGHHLDDETYACMLDRIYEVLAPGGTFFFVDVDPDHSEDGRNPANTGKWTSVHTPWGTEVPFFNRNPYDLVDMIDRHGFDLTSGGPLCVSPEGQIEPQDYMKYTSRPSRMAARYQKVDKLDRFCRINDVRIPPLIPTDEQMKQMATVARYFSALRLQLSDTLADIFTVDAVYDEKPGRRTPLQGLEQIREYWETNPVSQRKLRLASRIIGFSEGCAWAEFTGRFNVREQHVAVNGIIQFAIDPGSGRITKLTEHFNSNKTTL